MAYYIIEPNLKSKTEEKIIYQLGSVNSLENYNYAKNLEVKAGKVIKCTIAAGFGLPFIDALLLHTGFLVLVGILLIFISIFFTILLSMITKDKKKDAEDLSPDLKEMSESYEKDRLEINEYGISHIFLFKKGDDDSPDVYHKRYLSYENITEILRCESLGAYIFCGDTETYSASGNVLKKDPEKVKWRISDCEKFRSIRVYDCWVNSLSGLNDFRETADSLFRLPVREISAEEALTIINNDTRMQPRRLFL